MKSVLEVAEQKSREQRQLDSERWKAHVKAMKAGMRPPKSAGIKPGKNARSEKKEGEVEGEKPAEDSVAGMDAQTVPAPDVTEPPTPKSAGLEKPAGQQKKREGGKPNGNGPRRKGPASGDRRKKPAAAAKPVEGVAPAAPAPADASSAPTTTGAAQPAAVDNSASSFTDYKLNAPPADIKAVS